MELERIWPVWPDSFHFYVDTSFDLLAVVATSEAPPCAALRPVSRVPTCNRYDFQLTRNVSPPLRRASPYRQASVSEARRGGGALQKRVSRKSYLLHVGTRETGPKRSGEGGAWGEGSARSRCAHPLVPFAPRRSLA